MNDETYTIVSLAGGSSPMLGSIAAAGLPGAFRTTTFFGGVHAAAAMTKQVTRQTT
jgi:hypothetical protein